METCSSYRFHVNHFITEAAMDPRTLKVVHEATRASLEQRARFPQVVAMLRDAGIERYHADLVAGTRTYYSAAGAVATVAAGHPATPASTFHGAVVEAAVHATQRDEIQYLEFCDRIAAAGCVGYLVSLAGARALYYGRTGDFHVERFPGTRR
jgi:uncharacterized protein YbcV (DUF1398 family)